MYRESVIGIIVTYPYGEAILPTKPSSRLFQSLYVVVNFEADCCERGQMSFALCVQ